MKHTVQLSGFRGVGYRAKGGHPRACVYLPHSYDLDKMNNGLYIHTMRLNPDTCDPWSPVTPRENAIEISDVPVGAFLRVVVNDGTEELYEIIKTDSDNFTVVGGDPSGVRLRNHG